MKKALRAAVRAAADRDLRAYAAYAALHPREVPLERPRFGGVPPYLSNPRALGVVEPRRGFPPLLSWGGEARDLSTFELELPGARLTVPRSGSIAWDTRFQDSEQVAALHRFAWLLPKLAALSDRGCSVQSVSAMFDRTVSDWVSHHRAPSATEAWDPYTVSERCVNWIVALLACGRDPADSAFGDSFRLQIEHLRGHLEYHGERLTGNHLSNNGRALYIAGCALGENQWRRIGLEILLREKSRLFPESRFLREGSSHYQFLVCRNYCEALWFAIQWGDSAAATALKAVVSPLVEGCLFFLVSSDDHSWSYPLMGDISPDCPPSWLTGVPWVGASLCGMGMPSLGTLASGWHRFFLEPEARASSAHQAEAAPDVGVEWARARSGRWDAFVHLNPAGFPLCPGHAHQDTGAVSVFFAGRPVIVNAGRRHYVDDQEGRWGRSAWAHSLLLVDGADPAPEWRWFLASEFLRRRVGELPSFSRSESGVRVRHGGYARLGAGAVERTLSFKDGALVVADAVEGGGRCKLDLVFHLASEAAPEAGRLALWAPGFKGFLELPADLDELRIVRAPREGFFGWRVPSYGEKVPATTVIASGRVRLPWKGVSVLRAEI